MPTDEERTISLRERKKAKTMAMVQKHALRLFREIGYNATTVEQIAEVAEISPSTFFRYFPTKEDVILRDNYDPLIISAFEEQPLDLSPLAAVRNAMLLAVKDMSEEDLITVRERNQLIMSVPELRAATLNNLMQTMDMIAELIAKRVGRSPNDLDVRIFAGAIIGVNISVMQHHAEHPDSDFAVLLTEALSKLESGQFL
ncbi:TetR family transcriptional regulator [Paenibacillus sp. N1-5-1-14]|uniref:acyl-CoA-like ligand-binding transcription factor n=1 Tax=Paenibacillus radicibacter TaxID=2972488 RepID=UPI0021591547|nr:TetR family transcriptional regulator [Paenibacillus radicibacter]MCR8641288.1 TetR family transcriptional regulator [Paenibacillus radicibacter]